MALRDEQEKGLSARHGKTRFSRAGLFFGFRGGGGAAPCGRVFAGASRRLPEKGRETYRVFSPCGGERKARQSVRGRKTFPCGRNPGPETPGRLFLPKGRAEGREGRRSGSAPRRQERPGAGGVRICREAGGASACHCRTLSPRPCGRQGKRKSPPCVWPEKTAWRKPLRRRSHAALGKAAFGLFAASRRGRARLCGGVFPRGGSGMFRVFSAAEAGSHEY